MRCQWTGNAGCDEEATKRQWCYAHYSKLLRTQHIDGGMVDPTPAREHIQLCLARSGMKRSTFAALAGVDHNSVTWILSGRSARIRAATESRIRSVPPPPTATGLIRRLRALGRIGYPRTMVAAECGVNLKTLLSQEHRKKFSPSLGAAIVEVYERWSSTAGPSARAVGLARRATHDFPQGHPSPLAWEGLDIDDRDAVPDFGSETDSEAFDEVHVLEMMAGRLKVPQGEQVDNAKRLWAARREAARRLLGFGLTGPAIVDRLGCDSQTVDRIRARLRRDREAAA